jgi:hypothetical protein
MIWIHLIIYTGIGDSKPTLLEQFSKLEVDTSAYWTSRTGGSCQAWNPRMAASSLLTIMFAMYYRPAISKIRVVESADVAN